MFYRLQKSSPFPYNLKLNITCQQVLYISLIQTVCWGARDLNLHWWVCNIFHLFTLTLSIHCRMYPSISVFHCLLSVAFLLHLSPWLCPSTAGCSPPSIPSIVFYLLLFCFTFHQGFVHPLQDVALHQCLPLPSVCCFPVSPWLYPSTAGCSPPSMPSIVFCLLLFCFIFHLDFVHPLQDVALHQCLPLSSVAFLFHLSPRLCPSTAGCSPPSIPSIVFCLLLSCFTFHLGFVHPLQDVALHQYLQLSSIYCFPVSPIT